MSMYKNNDIVSGKVTGIEKYGFFVLTDDGYTGLVHISEISDKFVKNVFDYVKVDEVIYAKVIDIVDDNKKLKLSIKNFNYRLGDSDNEDTNGFLILKNRLSEWINEYESENVDNTWFI